MTYAYKKSRKEKLKEGYRIILSGRKNLMRMRIQAAHYRVVAAVAE